MSPSKSVRCFGFTSCLGSYWFGKSTHHLSLVEFNNFLISIDAHRWRRSGRKRPTPQKERRMAHRTFEKSCLHHQGFINGGESDPTPNTCRIGINKKGLDLKKFKGSSFGEGALVNKPYMVN